MTITLNGTTGITDVDGTAAAPAITGTDTDSGMYFGTNIVALATGGTNAVYVNASQNVGIGTSSPTQKLEVNGSAVLVGGSLTIGSGGNIGAGVIYSNVNYGMLFRALQASPALADFAWFNSANVERMRIDSSGNLLVGTTSVNYTGSGFTLSKDSGTTKWLCGPNTGNPTQFIISAASSLGVYLTSTSATAWTSASDERLKDIIEPIANGIQKVCELRAVIGSYKADKDKNRRPFLIAQDIQKVFPEAVDASDPDRLGVQYTEVIPLLVAAIKEQQALITSLTDRIAALEAR